MLKVPLDAECKDVFTCQASFLTVHNTSSVSNNWQSSILLSTRVRESRHAMLLRLNVLFGVKLGGFFSGFSRESNPNLKIYRLCCTESLNTCISVKCTAVWNKSSSVTALFLLPHP